MWVDWKFLPLLLTTNTILKKLSQISYILSNSNWIAIELSKYVKGKQIPRDNWHLCAHWSSEQNMFIVTSNEPRCCCLCSMDLQLIGTLVNNTAATLSKPPQSKQSDIKRTNTGVMIAFKQNNKYTTTLTT